MCIVSPRPTDAGHGYAPAKNPTPVYPPVERLIAPDIGGPASTPSETIIRYMPVRRPTLAQSPSAIIALDDAPVMAIVTSAAVPRVYGQMIVSTPAMR
jgi:hypothetical protein